MTSVLICLDTDGTVESSNGVVTAQRLLELQSAGATIVVVSPSPAYLKDSKGQSLFELRNQLTRGENLRNSKASHPSDLYLYVSDNGDNYESRAEGFIHVHPSDFR